MIKNFTSLSFQITFQAWKKNLFYELLNHIFHHTFPYDKSFFLKYFSFFHIFPNIPFNKFFTALFIIHPHTSLFFQIHFEYSFYKFLYTIFYVTSIAFLFFSNFQEQYFHKFYCTNMISRTIHLPNTFQIQTNFQTRNLHFEMTSFHTVFYLQYTTPVS